MSLRQGHCRKEEQKEGSQVWSGLTYNEMPDKRCLLWRDHHVSTFQHSWLVSQQLLMINGKAQKHWDQDADSEVLCGGPSGSPVMHEGAKTPAHNCPDIHVGIQQMTCDNIHALPNKHMNMQALHVDQFQHLGSILEVQQSVWRQYSHDNFDIVTCGYGQAKGHVQGHIFHQLRQDVVDTLMAACFKGAPSAVSSPARQQCSSCNNDSPTV